MWACCVSSHNEGPNLEPKTLPGLAALARPGSSAARTLVGERSPSMGLWPNSASLAVSVTLTLGWCRWRDGSGADPEAVPARVDVSRTCIQLHPFWIANEAIQHVQKRHLPWSGIRLDDQYDQKHEHNRHDLDRRIVRRQRDRERHHRNP